LQPEVPENMDGRILFTQQSPNIVGGQIYLYLLLLHLLTQLSIFPLHTHQYNPPTQAKDSKSNPHHMHDKGKAIVSPSSPSSDSTKSVSSRMHLRDDCSHVINEIKPQGSTQPKANSGKSKGDSNNKGKIVSQSGKYGF
jgi:hypothetical protein